MEGNNLLFRSLYREIDFTAITAPVFNFNVMPSESYDFILTRIQMQYYSDDADPSVFSSVNWRLEITQRQNAIQDHPVIISGTLNPGIFDQTAGTTRPKEYYYKSPRLDWPVKAHENLNFTFETPAGAGLLTMLLIGQGVLPVDIEVFA